MSSSLPAWSPPDRLHAADDIFEQLAAAILRGQLAVGARMPPERELAERFGVSRIIVRQAVHRLAEIGLVKLRQGGTTIVLDARDASNLAVLELEYRLGPVSPADIYDFTERQIMQGHAMLAIAERRSSTADLEELVQIVEDYAAEGGSAAQMPAFEERFWRKVAAACGNRLYQFETNWWFRLIATHPRSTHPVVAPPHARIAAFREIVRRLYARKDAAGIYLELASVLLQSVAGARPSKPARKPIPRSPR